MSSRAAPSVRADPNSKRSQRTKRGSTAPARDFPATNMWGGKAVCKRCGLVMPDAEPMAPDGEFIHVAKPHQKRALTCVNNLKSFHMQDKEIEPFMRKGRRRALKRAGIRA